jgi:hypothetical protein
MVWDVRNQRLVGSHRYLRLVGNVRLVWNFRNFWLVGSLGLVGD